MKAPTAAQTALRAAVRAACDLMSDWETRLAGLPACDLAPLLGELDELTRRGAAGRVAVTAEAVRRGVVAESQAGSLTDWVASHAPSQRAEGAWATAKAAEAVSEPARPGGATLRAAVLGGALTPSTAATVAAEFDRLQDRLQPAAAAGVLEAMIMVGAEAGPRGVRGVRPELVRRFGAAGDLQAEQDAAKACVSLSAARPDLPGTFRYELVLDAEGKAVLEAAIGPLSRPRPAPDGSADPRSAQRRRGDALTEVCRRGTEHAPDPRTPGGVKAALYLTMSLEDLVGRRGAATTIGTPTDSTAAAGTLLAPDTVRKIACDAGLIPAVLGSAGELLDVGRQHRLFTPGQLRALWLRDGRCTFPSCSVPAFWADAHHLIHWADDGPTDLANAALLCGRHHTIVHSQHLAGNVTPGGVRWNLVPDSYTEALLQFRRSR